MKKIIALFLILCIVFSAILISTGTSDADQSSRSQPPNITTTNVLTAYVGKYYSVNYTATDADTNQSSLVWGWTTNSTWLSFSSSQELKGTPTKVEVCWVNISVTDGTGYDFAVFYITVKSGSPPPTNQPPSITTTDVREAFVGKYYSVNYTATDADTNQSSLVWGWTTNSTWLSFSSSQELKGAPTKVEVCWVNISVTDGTSYDYAVFYITVKSGSPPPSNQPPSITTTNVLTAYVGKYYSVNYTATDADTNQSSLVWGWTTNSTWLTFSSTQELKGTPTKVEVCWVNISVTDSTSYDYTVFYIVVKKSTSPPSNQSPVITTTNVRTAYVGKYYSVNYTATDPDTNQSSLVWGWTTNSTWLTFSSTQELKGTPTKVEVCWVNISVTDGTSYDYAVFYITVNKATSPPSNQPPVITTKNVIEAFIGKNYSVQYTATDPDTSQSSLVWSWKTNSTWLSFSSSQELKGIPTKVEVCWVNITVTDGTSYDYAVFYITVKKSTSPPSNNAPVITTNNILYATVGVKYSVQYSATDPDTSTENLTWVFKTNSTWLTFSTSQLLSGTPTKPGVCWVNVSVTDGTSTDYAVFYIVVSKRNNSYAPMILTDSILENDIDVPTDTEKIAIAFSEPMDPSSVNSALKITPGVSHSISWNEENTVMTIIFNEELDGETEYIVFIDSSAQDIYGLNLEDEYKLEFTTEETSSDVDDTDTDDLPTKDKLDQSKTSNIPTIGIVVVAILIFIILAYMFVIKKRRTIDPDMNEGRIPFDGQGESTGFIQQPQTTTEQPVPVGDIDVIFENAKLDAFGPDKPSNAGPGKEAIMDELKLKLNKGEISHNTYDEAVNILSGKS